MQQAHIVLVEDNPADVMLVELALSTARIPHKLTRFETGVDAVRSLCNAKELSSPPDAIRLDLNTPRSDGFKVLADLSASANLTGVPIALFTSSKARSDKNKAELQHVRYIEKPSQLQDFLAIVGEAIKEMLVSRR
jgi:CheY-like chemotaxis protein